MLLCVIIQVTYQAFVCAVVFMDCPGALVYDVVCSPMFGVLPLKFNIFENQVFSEVHIYAAWDFHNIPISQVPSLRL